MARKLSEEPAFPRPHVNVNGQIDYSKYEGVPIRLYLAGIAMQGLLSAQAIYKDGVDAEWTAKTALNCADKLILEFNQ